MPYRVRLLAPLLLISGCVAAPPVAPPAVVVAMPTSAPLPSAPFVAAWQDWPVTPGSWSYGRHDDGSVATFGSAQERLASINCLVTGRQVAITGAGGTGTITVRTSSATRTLATERPAGTSPFDRALLVATDPLLDAMAFSRGRFVLQRAGAAPLVLPAHAEVGRVIEDCRR